jgi:STE24 endopeptidase
MQAFRVVLAALAFTIIAFFLCPAPDRLAAAASNAQPQWPAFTGSTGRAPTVLPATIRKVTEYTLPPDLYKKAHDLGRTYFRLRLVGFVYRLIVSWLILHWQLGPKYRDWAERSSAKRFLQTLVFSPLLLTIAVLTLPLAVYAEMVEKRFGLSVQGWGSWSWDWVKAELLQLVIGTLLIWLLYDVIRRSPRRGWVYFWLLSLPIGVFLFFIGPWVIDPMFHKFAPLQQKNPALAVSLERMVQRAGASARA